MRKPKKVGKSMRKHENIRNTLCQAKLEKAPTFEGGEGV